MSIGALIADFPSVLQVTPGVAWLAAALLIAGMALLGARRRVRAAAAAKDAEIEALRDEVWELKEAAAARSRAEAANEAKSRFLATVSHEIRTPLSGVLGLADLLMDGPLTGEQRAYVDAIKTSGAALSSLIDEILDFARIEAGKIELACEAIDLRGLVEGVVELLAPRAHGKGIEISAIVASDLPPLVLGDSARLRQVLMNLAGNAVKFTDRGGVGVSVRRAEDRIRFTVADTGIGVAPHRQAAIFGEFERGDGSAVRGPSGTGLGLAIAKRLVERMNGVLALESSEGKGSVFRFDIPLSVAKVAAPTDEYAGMLAGKKVLLAANSIFERPFLATSLAEAGAHVVEAESAEEALALLADRPSPDVAIVDCALGAAAIDAVAEAARLAGVAKRLILFSPFERRAFGQRSVTAFDGWLVKPVRARSLFARLSDAPCADASGERRLALIKPSQSGRGLRVLLAEDDDINALIAMTFLARLGVSAVRVRDGEAALHAFDAALRHGREAFDIVIMDIRMPDLDGYEAARHLRRTEAMAGSGPVRLIALTASASADDRQACLQSGFDVFIPKPIDFAALGAALLRPASLARTG